MGRSGLPKIPGPRRWREDVRDMAWDESRRPAEGDRLNAYVCDGCGRWVVTRDVHEGVTPMFLACRFKGEPTDSENDCKGRSVSSMYKLEMLQRHLHEREVYPSLIPREWPEPTWEWYMPDAAEMKRLRRHKPRAVEHAERGGLSLRRIEG